MRRAVCPGSFDPVTHGHLDIIARAAGLFDEVVVGVLVNESKRSLLSTADRVRLLRQALAEAAMANVVVDEFSGLLVDFCRRREASAIVKGLRAGSDFDYELPMAQMNEHLTGITTVFLPADHRWSFVSSSLVKEVHRLGGDVSALIPATALSELDARQPR
jgi:pantetheine-phosphate adenylyltransferase